MRYLGYTLHPTGLGVSIFYGLTYLDTKDNVEAAKDYVDTLIRRQNRVADRFSPLLARRAS